MSASAKLKLEHWPITKLKPYERNPRKNDAAIDRMVASIKEFGFSVPILIKSDGEIIAGHLRTKAARKIGMKQLPVIICDGWTDAQVKAFRLMENKSVSWAEWDADLLKLEFADLKALDFDLDLTGFDLGEISDFFSETDARPGEKVRSIITSSTLEELAPSETERAVIYGRAIKIEFSGGKDSSATAIWAKHYFPDADLELCYVDMGADFIGYQIFLRQFAEAMGVKLRVLRSSENIIELILSRGWPKFTHPWCHDFLHDAMNQYFETCEANQIVIMRGGRLEEKAAQQGKQNDTRFLIIDKMKAYSYFQPLYFATKEAGETILTASGLPIWDGYGHGLQRTACRVCPGQRMQAYSAIRVQYPDVWQELIYLEQRLGAGCWSDPLTNCGQGSFVDLADRGHQRYLDGHYRLR
jgi:3'-phosphoadenosine 5'-phosphosulfate sulfotransferase (PAPS reductase)/FAD synthetase